MQDVQSLRDGTAVRVRQGLPGIAPTHMCTRCPTFFCGRDRYYLTARHEESVHGIAVWPHGQSRVRIELGDDGMLFVFGDTIWVLLPAIEVPMLISDHFRGKGQRDMIFWSRRRGFSIQLVPAGTGKANVRVDPPGPHFSLLVAKTWAQQNMLRNAQQTLETLDDIGAAPFMFGQADVPP